MSTKQWKEWRSKYEHYAWDLKFDGARVVKLPTCPAAAPRLKDWAFNSESLFALHWYFEGRQWVPSTLMCTWFVIYLDYVMSTGVTVRNLTTAALKKSKQRGKDYDATSFVDSVTTFLWAVKRLEALLSCQVAPAAPVRGPEKVTAVDARALGFPRPSAAIPWRPRLDYPMQVAELLCRRADENPVWKDWYPKFPSVPVKFIAPWGTGAQHDDVNSTRYSRGQGRSDPVVSRRAEANAQTKADSDAKVEQQPASNSKASSSSSSSSRPVAVVSVATAKAKSASSSSSAKSKTVVPNAALKVQATQKGRRGSK